MDEIQRGPREPLGAARIEAVFICDPYTSEGFSIGGLKEDLYAQQAVETAEDWRKTDNVGLIARRGRGAK